MAVGGPGCLCVFVCGDVEGGWYVEVEVRCMFTEEKEGLLT
jgi:hypothetical protein